MKLRHYLALLSTVAASASLGVAAESASSAVVPNHYKNLARHHLGTNLFVYNADSGTYVPTEAAAAWLDDDVTTAWPPAAGKQYYLLALPEAQLMTDFEISAKDDAGIVSIYAGDEPSAPTAASWKPVARDLAVSQVNDSGMPTSFSRFAKYLLIETNIEDPTPWFSVYVYGNRNANAYSLKKRPEKISADAIYGPFVNDQTAFSYSSLYAASEVGYADSADGSGQYRNAIDDNPRTSVSLSGQPAGSNLVVNFNEPRTIERVAVLANREAKGRLDLFASTQPAGSAAPDLANLSPVASLDFDGSTDRASMEFPAVSASSLVARWVPADGSQPIEVREINSFGDIGVEGYAVNAAPETITDQGDGQEIAYNDYDASKGTDGKQLLDYGDGKKTMLDPIAELLPLKTPFVPGGLGYPPNLPPREVPLSN